MNALDAISTPQPEFSRPEVLRALVEEFGVVGSLDPLVSERDQNFQVTTDFQIQALLHILRRDCPVATLAIRRTLAGNESTLLIDGDIPHVCRLVSYLTDTPLSAISATPELARDFRRCAANLDLALANFEHAGDSQVLLWDLQHAGDLRELIAYVEETELRAVVSLCQDDYDRRVQPKLPSLRRQVIHGDLNAAPSISCCDSIRWVGFRLRSVCAALVIAEPKSVEQVPETGELAS